MKRNTAASAAAGFLQRQDPDFDSCRAFMVVSMIFAHAFETFHVGGIGTFSYFYYTTVGFVFLSGLALAVRHGASIGEDPCSHFRRLTKIAMKLLAIFALSNLIIFFIMPERFDAIVKIGVFKVLPSVFLMTNQALFGFDVLVPIAMAIFVSWFVLAEVRGSSTWGLLFLLFISVWVSRDRYAGVTLTVFGLMGTLSGNVVRRLPWYELLKHRFVPPITGVLTVLVVAHYVLLYLFRNRYCPETFRHNFIPALFVLLLVYLLSYRMRLGERPFIRTWIGLLSRYLLFSYLFHILVLNVFLRFLGPGGRSFLVSAMIGLATLGLTAVAAWLLDRANRRSTTLAKCYALAFK
jgi:peptidoglycan/LPS O-acetylase OafA/YrhL